MLCLRYNILVKEIGTVYIITKYCIQMVGLLIHRSTEPLMEQDMLTLPEQLPHFNSCSILVFQLLSFLFFYDYVCTADLYTECPNITEFKWIKLVFEGYFSWRCQD
jgi:hypothetical protein